MNELTVFNFGSLPIRTYTDENGEPWFCLSDTCTALNIKQYRADRLPLSGVTNCQVRYDSGAKTLLFVNEPNLYRLVFRSNKPEAQKFANWVYSEVLPTIRKTGSYMVATKEKSSTNIDEIKKAIVAALQKNNAPLSFKINGEVISVPEPVYKGIHTGLLQLDPIMHNLSKVIEGACRKAVREELEAKLNKIKAVM